MSDTPDTPTETVTRPANEAESPGLPPVRADLPHGLAGVVEALLFASDAPLSAAKIAEIVTGSTTREIREIVTALNESYSREQRVFRIETVAGGFQMLTLSEYNPWIGQLLQVKQETKLSSAAMETLAIVAYKQPVLRADVEAVRGVSCGEMLNRLRETNLIKIVGRAEDLGRPILYGTTKRFLEVFGLASLDDLPDVTELSPPPA